MVIVQIDEPSTSSSAASTSAAHKHNAPRSRVDQRYELSDIDAQLVDAITAQITPSIEEVADWHFVDTKLRADWDTPLTKVLRFFVEDNSGPDGTRDVINFRNGEQPTVAA